MIQSDHIDPADPRVVSFYDAACGYCSLIDKLRQYKSEPLYLDLMLALSALNEAAIRLPYDMPDVEVKGNGLSHEAWKLVENEIGKAVTPACELVLATKPSLDGWEAGRIRLLADDLADIYNDLDCGIQMFQSGKQERTAEAIWIWRFNYEVHWGRHLYRALHTVHEIRCLNYLD